MVTAAEMTRLGRFYVQTDLVGSGEVAQFLAAMEFSPTRVEHIYHRKQFEYVGISPEFVAIGPGELVPWYDIANHIDADGKASVQCLPCGRDHEALGRFDTRAAFCTLANGRIERPPQPPAESESVEQQAEGSIAP